MRVKNPAELVLEYTGQMMAWLLFLEPPKEEAIGMLGLGAGSLARFCAKHTRSPLLAVEWNPAVTAAGHMFFRLPGQNRLQVEHADAGAWVADPLNAGRCPVLMVDLYDAQAQGPVRDSVKFYRDCRRVLGEVGVLAVNLFGRHESFGKNIDNLSKAFDDRVILLPEIDAGNQIVLAFSGPRLAVTPAELLGRAAIVEARYGLGAPLGAGVDGTPWTACCTCERRCLPRAARAWAPGHDARPCWPCRGRRTQPHGARRRRLATA